MDKILYGNWLAGELGAGITLVSELLPKEKRGIGTSVVAGVGLTGAVLAFFIAAGADIHLGSDQLLLWWKNQTA